MSSESQQITLALLPKFSSVLSFLGSGWITAEVLTGRDATSRKRKYHHPYHRLLLGMSIIDIMESIANVFSTWALPSDTEDVWMPLGNQATCNLQGFFVTWSAAVPIYNASLSLYYVLVINYNIPDRRIAKCTEPTMHGIALTWGIGVAMVALFMDMLNSANLWCWIAPLPSDCLDSRRYPDDANCERGDNAWIYRWAFFYAPLWTSLLLATVFTAMVAWKVYKIDQVSLKYRNPERRVSLVGVRSDSFSAANENSDSFRYSGSRGNRGVVLEGLSELDEDNNDDNNVSSNEDDQASRRSFRTSFSKASERMGSWRESRKQFKKDNPRTVEVFSQAILYVSVFYLTYMWSFINRLLQQTLGHSFYGLVFCQAIFDPLQGFLNYFVYQRPRYLKERKEHPHLTRFQCLCNILRLTSWADPVNRTRSSSLSSRGTSANQQSADFAAAPLGRRNFSSTLNRSSRQSISDLAAVEEVENESADQEPSSQLIQCYDSDSDDEPDPADSGQFGKEKMQKGAIVDVDGDDEGDSSLDGKEVSSRTKEMTDNEEPPVEDCDANDQTGGDDATPASPAAEEGTAAAVVTTAAALGKEVSSRTKEMTDNEEPPVEDCNANDQTGGDDATPASPAVEEGTAAAVVTTTAAAPAIARTRSEDTQETNEIEFVPESQELVPENHSEDAAVVAESTSDSVVEPDTSTSQTATAESDNVAADNAEPATPATTPEAAEPESPEETAPAYVDDANITKESTPSPELTEEEPSKEEELAREEAPDASAEESSP